MNPQIYPNCVVTTISSTISILTYVKQHVMFLILVPFHDFSFLTYIYICIYILHLNDFPSFDCTQSFRRGGQMGIICMHVTETESMIGSCLPRSPTVICTGNSLASFLTHSNVLLIIRSCMRFYEWRHSNDVVLITNQMRVMYSNSLMSCFNLIKWVMLISSIHLYETIWSK